MRAAPWIALFAACAPTTPSTVSLPAPSGSASQAAAPTTSSSIALAAEGGSAELDPEAAAPLAVVDPSEGVGLVEGPRGHIGAFLALGPFRLGDKAPATVETWTPAPSIDDHALVAAYGATIDAQIDVPTREVKDDKSTGKIKGWTKAPAKWTVVTSSEGALDLERILGSGGKPAVAYLASTLRLPAAQKLVLLVGADDGCEVLVDGTSRFIRDASRPQRDDDDLVPLDLSAGDHTFLFKVHQHDAGWAIRVRLVDEALRPPIGARWLLPKAPASVADELAKAMSLVHVDRATTDDGYALTAEVKFVEGAPIASPITVAAAVVEKEKVVVEKKALGAVVIGKRSVEPFAAVIERGLLASEDHDLVAQVEVGGRVVESLFHPRKEVRSAIVGARKILDGWKAAGRPASMPDDVEATLAYLSDRLAQETAHGDEDLADEIVDAKILSSYVADAEAGKDPITSHPGVMRIAHVAKADGKPQPLTLFVPKLEKTDKKKALFVGLHGMNGGPMSMMRVFFGGDEPSKSMGEMERPTPDYYAMKSFDGFVLAPHAYGNAMYRQLGEEEVMDAIAWAEKRFPQIDLDRVSMTGFSMGGIGAASIPLHHPDVFAATEPLCGYHSYFIRRDVQWKPKRPWEDALVDERSNTSWAENGARLPMWIVHGTHDLPTENSSVLVDTYEKLGFSVKHDEPDKGHDVWGWAYDGMQHVHWLAPKRRTAHPKHVRIKTARTRFGDDTWVHVERLAEPTGWGVVNATVDGKTKIRVSTKGVDAFRLDRDPELVGEGALTVVVDETTFSFEGEIAVHREAGAWKSGPAIADGELHKEGKITGPIRDVWSEPLVFVYGASDPMQTEANLEVAEHLARVRWGTDVAYPIVKDSDVDPAAIPSTSVVLVGNAKSNRVLRALEAELPMSVNGGVVSFAGKSFSGAQVGAAFVVPHPKAHDKYLLVVEGVDALGTFRALSLPDLLPDFVVWDERLAPARGQTLLSFGAVLAAGTFDTRWKAPATFDDPLLQKAVAPKNEKDATPYLP